MLFSSDLYLSLSRFTHYWCKLLLLWSHNEQRKLRVPENTLSHTAQYPASYTTASVRCQRQDIAATKDAVPSIDAPLLCHLHQSVCNIGITRYRPGNGELAPPGLGPCAHGHPTHHHPLATALSV